MEQLSRFFKDWDGFLSVAFTGSQILIWALTTTLVPVFRW
jgi:hypothetical protein